MNMKSLQKAKHKLYEQKEIEELTNKILKEISENSDMNIGDLIRITNKRVERRLKETEGLLWHYRLNHASLSQMRLMKLDMPELKKVVLGNDIKNCLHCRLAKAKRLPFDQERTRATRILEKVHSDTLGPINPCGFRTAHKYIITFKDDYSRYGEAYTMFDKTQVDIALHKFLQKLRLLSSFDYKPVEHLINRNEGRQVSCKNGNRVQDCRNEEIIAGGGDYFRSLSPSYATT